LFELRGFTETIGIHGLFGGFIAGVVMPSSPGVQAFLREKIESFSAAALLPLFFVFRTTNSGYSAK
jgi:Kef-type K+ transport system membrane component KefB